MVIIKDVDGNDRYGITRDNEMCYEILKWVPEHKAEKNGRNVKEGDLIEAKWATTGHYPDTFASAIRGVLDMLTAEGLSQGERGLKAAIGHAQEIRDSIMSQLEGVVLPVEKKEKGK